MLALCTWYSIPNNWSFCWQTEKSLELLDKFENISGPHLELKDKYVICLHSYGKDLEAVRNLYQDRKTDPVIPRNLPPISGRIFWARQLYRKIESPLKIFKKKPDILKVCVVISYTLTVIAVNSVVTINRNATSKTTYYLTTFGKHWHWFTSTMFIFKKLPRLKMPRRLSGITTRSLLH